MSSEFSLGDTNAFYLNFILGNTKELVASSVNEKMKGMGVFRMAAKGLASSLVSAEKVTDGFSEKISEILPKILQDDAGIDAKFEKKFTYKNFCVIRVEVKSLEFRKLMAKSKGDEFADTFEDLMNNLDKLGLDEQRAGVEAKIHSKVTIGLYDKLAELLPEKLTEKGLSCEVKACSLNEQAEFFFQVLEELNEDQKGKK